MNPSTTAVRGTVSVHLPTGPATAPITTADIVQSSLAYPERVDWQLPSPQTLRSLLEHKRQVQQAALRRALRCIGKTDDEIEKLIASDTESYAYMHDHADVLWSVMEVRARERGVPANAALLAEVEQVEALRQFALDHPSHRVAVIIKERAAQFAQFGPQYQVIEMVRDNARLTERIRSTIGIPK